MHDCVVIGGGPAGMTSALYLLRAGKSVLILEKDSFGGQIAKSPRLENYPSIQSISGLEWSDNLFNQITELGAEFELEDVQGIEKDGDVFRVSTDYGTHEAKTVIIASGCSHRQLGLERENELVGHGISYCAVCDGDFFREKDVLLIGDANTALQYAIMLAEKCSHVTIATLFDRFFADQILIDRIKAIPNLDYYHNLESQEFLGDPELVGVRFKDTKTGEMKVINCDGCFIAIGQIPHNEPFANLVDLDHGFILTDDRMQTKTPGLFAAGDCRVTEMRQVVTATSNGALAAIEAAKYLNTKF